MKNSTYKNKLAIKALVFDMDGTMIDNMMVHHRAWQKRLRDLGLEMTLEEVKRDIHGVNDEILIRLFGDKYSKDEMTQIARSKEADYRELYAPDIKLLDGLKEFLENAKHLNIPMGIGTAAPKENADFTVEALGLGSYFKTVVHSDMVQRGKPDPQVFELVAKNLGIKLSDCVVFEDSPTGAQAAANGDSKSIILTTTHAEQEFEHIPQTLHFMSNYENIAISKENEAIFYLHYT